MKILAFLALLSMGLGILDRTYYDALCTPHFIENSQSALIKKMFEMHSEDFLKNITQTETQDQRIDSKRSMLVSGLLFSLLNSV
jgi:hypothetical protein